MTNSITSLFFALFVMIFNNFFSQEFPKDWIGNYKGVMEVINPKGSQKVTVKLQILTIKENEAWTYKMTYLPENQEKSVKDYVIRKTENGYVMDEKDGILIQMAWLGNGFYDYFELDNMFFTSRLTKEKKGLTFELYGGSRTENVSRNEELDITVTSFVPQFVQRVQLKKLK